MWDEDEEDEQEEEEEEEEMAEGEEGRGGDGGERGRDEDEEDEQEEEEEEEEEEEDDEGGNVREITLLGMVVSTLLRAEGGAEKRGGDGAERGSILSSSNVPLMSLIHSYTQQGHREIIEESQGSPTTLLSLGLLCNFSDPCPGHVIYQ